MYFFNFTNNQNFTKLILTFFFLNRLVISISGIAGYNYYKIRKTSDDKKGRYHALPSHKNED